ncbi:GntR family transcriptional regulator [Aeromicrobium sp. CTD01-1L150]|uniref:GntR family transcriptional regulator n=1 Tax=Aeromicrobium sp. CTD01-1L150 TaxID=3341830 RepID=UPI0035C17FAF
MTTGVPVGRGVSLREQVEEVLTAAIISGSIAPGEIMTVPVLAERHGVSATPVREAMLNLARRGFVTPMRNKGFQVRAVDHDELVQLVHARRLLEAPPMVDVAAIFTADHRADLDDLVQAIGKAAAERDFPAYVLADKEFHLKVLGLLDNPLLVRLVSDLRDQTRTIGIASTISPEHLAASIEEHAELLDLLQEGDGSGAAALMERHIGHVLGWWSGRDEDGEQR